MFTYQVIGLKLAVWRFMMVPLIAVVLGLTMAFIFRREEESRQAEARANPGVALVEQAPEQARRAGVFFGLLVALMVFGAWKPLNDYLPGSWGQIIRTGGVVVGVGALIVLALRWFGKEETREWGRQTYLLVRMIAPIFIVFVVGIGIAVNFIPLSWIMPTAAEEGGLKFGHPQGNALLPVFLTAVFSTLMYFPMLTEVVFTKGLLLKYFALGPALALLLGGPGLSLPGLALVSKVAGWKKMIIYWAMMVCLITLVSFVFGSYFGRYICSCQLQGG
jgi:uncharacterized membrane protein YraQ (UPF0718 family)